LLRPRTDARILAEIPMTELLERDLIPVYPDMPLAKLIPWIRRSRRNHFPVEDRRSGRFLGMINFADIKEFLFDDALAQTVLVEEVMRSDGPIVGPDESLPQVLALFDRTGAWSLPVVQNDRFLGLISKSTILDHYRKELKAQTEL
jgi:CIC family chloride channel protein